MNYQLGKINTQLNITHLPLTFDAVYSAKIAMAKTLTRQNPNPVFFNG